MSDLHRPVSIITTVQSKLIPWADTRQRWVERERMQNPDGEATRWEENSSKMDVRDKAVRTGVVSYTLASCGGSI